MVTLNPGDTINKGDKVATLSDDTRLRLEQYYSYAYAGGHQGRPDRAGVHSLF